MVNFLINYENACVAAYGMETKVIYLIDKIHPAQQLSNFDQHHADIHDRIFCVC